MPEEDGTAFFEDVLTQASERYADILQSVMDRIAPRPLFSEKVSAEQQLADWRLIREYPDEIAKFFSSENASVESAVEYAWKMESKLRQAGGEAQ